MTRNIPPINVMNQAGKPKGSCSGAVVGIVLPAVVLLGLSRLLGLLALGREDGLHDLLKKSK